MRQRLVQVLESNEGDEPMDAVVRRFWSRTTRFSGGLSGSGNGPSGARVVDLAGWVRARVAPASPTRF
jgi:hypothetical protein